MKKKFVYITKRFAEEVYQFQWDLKHIITNTSLFINDSDDGQICYIDINHEMDDVIQLFLKYLKSIKHLIEGKSLVMVIYNFQHFSNIKKISKYFKEVFYFSELRGNVFNVFDLYSIKSKYISLLPVSSAINNCFIPRNNLNKLPNNNVFLSLWHNSYNLDIIESTVRSNPDLQFWIPNRIYTIWGPYDNWERKDFDLNLPNLNIVKSYTYEYINAVNKCDVVIISFSYKEEKNNIEMFWWSRLSNALRWKKYIIINKNYINEIVMAKDGETCIGVWEKIDEINNAIKHIYSGKFKINKKLLDKIKKFIDIKKRLKYMHDYVLKYTDDERLSEELNFKFDKNNIKTLKWYFKHLLKNNSPQKALEDIEIDNFGWVKKWDKIWDFLIYKMLKDRWDEIKVKMYILDIVLSQKIILQITNQKWNDCFLKTKNGYRISFIWLKTITTQQEKIVYLIKEILEKAKN